MKRILVAALSILMVFALVACSSTPSDSSASASTEASEEASTEASEEASTEASEEATTEASEEASTEASEEASTEASSESGGTGNTTGETITVGIINNPPSESGYREANVKNFEEVFSAENGYDAKTYYSLKNDEQLNAAQQFITDGVDYLLISAAETTGWDTVLQSAQEAGIGVFLFDRQIDVPEDLYEAAVVSDMAKEGETAVDWIRENVDDPKVVHIQGTMGSDAQLGRTGALQTAADNGELTIVTQQTASWDEAQAKKIMESVINSGDEFNVIYAENDGMARGAVQALDEAGITHGVDGDVAVMGFDCNKWALRELLDGKWNYDGQCSPFQAQAISDMIVTLATGGTIDQKVVISEEEGFTADTITEEDVETYGLGSE